MSWLKYKKVALVNKTKQTEHKAKLKALVTKAIEEGLSHVDIITSTKKEKLQILNYYEKAIKPKK